MNYYFSQWSFQWMLKLDLLIGHWVGHTGALWQQLSLNHLSDVEYITAINMHRISNGLMVRGNIQTEGTYYCNLRRFPK